MRFFFSLRTRDLGNRLLNRINFEESRHCFLHTPKINETEMSVTDANVSLDSVITDKVPTCTSAEP